MMQYFHKGVRKKKSVKRTWLLAWAASLAVIVLGSDRPAHAGFVISPTFGSSITSDPNAAIIEATINAAIAIYEARFTDPITVTIVFNEMSSGLGSSSTAFASVPYASYLAALTADAKTSDDATALAHLGAGPNNPVNGNAFINVKTANLRAVGINVLGSPDGSIGLNTHITNPGSPGTSNTYDLMAVVEHEIDEILGLGSALPTPPFGTIFPEDLYRYNSTGGRSFNTNNSAHAYFSIDGTTLLDEFNNVNNGGDYGDWIQHSPAQVQDYVGTPGAHPTLGVELTALDVIGYDLAPSGVPEPATLSLLGAGALCLLGYKFRRKRPA